MYGRNADRRVAGVHVCAPDRLARIAVARAIHDDRISEIVGNPVPDGLPGNAAGLAVLHETVRVTPRSVVVARDSVAIRSLEGLCAVADQDRDDAGAVRFQHAGMDGGRADGGVVRIDVRAVELCLAAVACRADEAERLAGLLAEPAGVLRGAEAEVALRVRRRRGERGGSGNGGGADHAFNLGARAPR